MKSFPLYIFLCLGLVACGGNKADEEQDPAHDSKAFTLTPAELQSSGVRLGRIESRDVGNTLILNGRVNVPQDYMNTISSPIGGTVKALYVHEGQPVGAGAILLHLQSMEFIQLQEDFLTARQQMSFAQQEMERQRTLVEGNATAAKTLQKASTEYEGQRVRYYALRTRLQVLGIDADGLSPDKLMPYLPIMAARSGIVQRLKATPGAYVRPEDALMSLINKNQLHIDLQIFAQDVPKVRIGQQVKVYFPGTQKVAWEGTLHSLDAAFDPQQSYLAAHIHIDRNTTPLVSGMLVRCDLKLDAPEPVPALPDGAFVEEEGKVYVYAADSTGKGVHFHRLAVSRGSSAGGYTAIADTSVLRGYNRFVSAGASLLNEQGAGE